eukprot:6103259-Amphidinium_carterae.1
MAETSMENIQSVCNQALPASSSSSLRLWMVSILNFKAESMVLRRCSQQHEKLGVAFHFCEHLSSRGCPRECVAHMLSGIDLL